ncbi:predicted protein [Plenodomus lingam JN3]|uniref:Uncharacterized protein n=1 Tax=Leptosphaeria maculans (strain JN3 / isolate v23.1.3 / race Av1-4-5-6-7-8) TaxID=985895 RepID=M1ZJP9_LEPMJ|nr:predicted protein [Plenodomus lingam JN3]
MTARDSRIHSRKSAPLLYTHAPLLIPASHSFQAIPAPLRSARPPSSAVSHRAESRIDQLHFLSHGIAIHSGTH